MMIEKMVYYLALRSFLCNGGLHFLRECGDGALAVKRDTARVLSARFLDGGNPEVHILLAVCTQMIHSPTIRYIEAIGKPCPRGHACKVGVGAEKE
jgi:hypothetical protein